MASALQPGAEIAVIGAGVSGLVTAKRLADEGFTVTVYERRQTVGGLWNFSSQPEDPSSSTSSVRFASAVYAALQTNFPRQLMELQDFPFRGQPMFMSHKLILRYLQDYRKTIYDVRFRTDKEVVHLYYSEDPGTDAAGAWRLTTRDVSTGMQVEKEFAAVVSAVGVFDRPFVPRYEGLEEFGKTWPGSVSHAKSFRSAKPFSGKKVLIVGFGASGFDIARQVSPHAAKLWVSSGRDISDQVPTGTKVVPEIEHFDRNNRIVVFRNGTKIWRVDHVIFCTGYSFSQPFITHSKYSGLGVFPDGNTIRDLHEHIIFKQNPTLAFVGMVKGGAPTFWLVQAQAAFLSRFWAGHLPVKTAAAVQATASDDAQAEHVVPMPQYMDYLLRLEQACVLADRGRKLDDNLPVRWTLELDWITQNRRLIREAFLENTDKDQKSISNPDQLGFVDRSLAPSSQNIMLVVPFLVLHAAYFPDRQMEIVKRFFPRETYTEPFPGLDLFVRVSKIFESTREQLGPGSEELFEAGAKRLLMTGLDRMEGIVADIDEKDEDVEMQFGSVESDVTNPGESAE